ncbi:MAG: YHYH protein [Bacteroidetes bacterium]|nr:YHYH protein [Bacteroidota bacterium]
MRKSNLFIAAAVLAISGLQAQGPAVTSWSVNTTGATGYGGIQSNVQQVQYSTNNVYVSCTCIPGYAIGPWSGNPNTPSNQNFVYKITRNPTANTSGTLTSVGLGHSGVWINGVSIFNVSDAQSYNNAGVWNRNAYFWEGSGFDNCLGHPNQTGEYHHHVSPSCLYDINDNTHHSPIIGYAFDGYPVYGAYAYTNTNGTGAIKRMTSSYQTTTTATRTNGPAVSSTYPVGCFIEDYVYTAGSGDLDAHNGRYCVTPEYPGGTYAYFVTLDASLNPQFPYTMYGTYYGVVQSGNTGPGGGHTTITETVTTYTPATTGIAEVNKPLETMIYPNPTHDYLFVYIQPIASNNFELTLVDAQGKVVLTEKNIQPTISYTLDVSKLAKGIYMLRLKNAEKEFNQKVLVN